MEAAVAQNCGVRGLQKQKQEKFSETFSSACCCSFVMTREQLGEDFRTVAELRATGPERGDLNLLERRQSLSTLSSSGCFMLHAWINTLSVP